MRGSIKRYKSRAYDLIVIVDRIASPTVCWRPLNPLRFPNVCGERLVDL